jgi:nitric oxide reductase NorQ protein
MMDKSNSQCSNQRITTLSPKSGKGFVRTSYIQNIIDRSTNYIKAGYPVHLRGISGIGKTTVAFCIAETLGRPVMLIQGDDEMTTTDLVGGETGYHSRKIHDNFIHSVLKVDERVDRQWVDSRLTVAVEKGYTLIYDEYTRSKAEANNVLLSILQEGVLSIPSLLGGKSSCIKVHPDFSAIFTSNPGEYAGVHKSADALSDRMITLDLDHFDEETEMAIVSAKTNISAQNADKIVKIVRELRSSVDCNSFPTVRASIMIAKSFSIWEPKIKASFEDEDFRQICYDILLSKVSGYDVGSDQSKVDIINEVIKKVCGVKKKNGADALTQTKKVIPLGVALV